MRSLTKSIIIVIVGLAVLIPFASPFPDGLERVAESLGIDKPEALWSGPMADYAFPFIENPYMTTLISGLIGIFLALGITWVVGTAIVRKNRVSK